MKNILETIYKADGFMINNRCYDLYSINDKSLFVFSHSAPEGYYYEITFDHEALENAEVINAEQGLIKAHDRDGYEVYITLLRKWNFAEAES